MTNNQELKPCSVCGSIPDVNYINGWFWVCHLCSMSKFSSETREEVVEAWNTRSQEGLMEIAEELGLCLKESLKVWNMNSDNRAAKVIKDFAQWKNERGIK